MDTAVPPVCAHQPPSRTFSDLFATVALMNLFPAKDWADALPKVAPERILDAFRTENPATPAAMLVFVRNWFDLPKEVLVNDKDASLERHIESTWPALIRPSLPQRSGDSLIALPYPSIAPGGRFRECYYWDTYFTLLGMRHRPEIIRASVDNFRWLIENFGFIPNGNRTYYLSRSHPPFFFKIIELLADVEGPDIIQDYLPALIQEHRFWMQGSANLETPGAHRRVVRLPDGSILNRYWDDQCTPRDESYAVDVATAALAPDRPSHEVYLDIRAACESGWDFSSRWLDRRGNLGSIATTSILPADLNSILFGLEQFIAAGLAASGDNPRADQYEALAASRRQSMNRHLWNETLGAFDDFDWRRGHLRGAASAAVSVPLFFGLATEDQARHTARLVQSQLLAPGGLLTTAAQTDLQWDAPNGWAPLHWIAANGLERYGHTGLASDIRTRWLNTVGTVFGSTNRLVEKYDVMALQPGGGGEYIVQDGFGWTNGVTKAFAETQHAAKGCEPRSTTGKTAN